MSPPRVELRSVHLDDARALATLYTAERSFLAPFEPTRDEAFYSTAGQRRILERTIGLRVAGFSDRFLILADEALVGVLTVNNIVRGVFQSGSIGYFVAQAHNRRGIATQAVARVCEWAFGASGLHRLEAGTLIDNLASQRVLEHNGFTRIGVAPRYLLIAGRWQDHVLFQRLAEESSLAGYSTNFETVS